MELIHGLTICAQTFSIDDKQLVDCTLVDCTIQYGGGRVILERTELRGCRYLFTGSAKTTLEFLDCVGLLPTQVSGISPASINVQRPLIH